MRARSSVRHVVLTVVALQLAGAGMALDRPARGIPFGDPRALPPRVARELRAVQPGPAAGPVVEANAAAAVSFARSYGGALEDTAYLAKATSDGGFILAGETSSFGAGQKDAWIFKTDSAGAIVWQKTFGTTGQDIGEVEQTSDGGFVLGLWTSGSGGSAVAPFTLVKLTEAGAISWQKSYGTAEDTFASVYPITGGYLLTASSFGIGGAKSTNTVVKLNTDGTIAWQRVYSSSAYHSGFIQQLADGSLLASGTRIDGATGASDAFLAKLSSTGQILWQKTYGGPGADYGSYAVSTADGGFVIVGMTQSWGVNAGSDEDSDAWVVKLDGSGNVQWSSAYGGAKNEFATIQPASGGYVLTGVTNSYGAGKDDLFLATLNGTGGFLSGKTYGGPDDDIGSIVPDSSGGGYLLQATTSSFGAGNDDFLLAKLDASGNITWQHTYGGANDDLGGATRLADGSLFISGDTKSWGAGDYDAWAIKLNSSGALAASPAPGAFTAATCPVVGNPALSTGAFTFTLTLVTLTPGTDDFVDSTPGYTSTTASITTGTSTATTTDLCSAQQNLGATAAADKTSGAAPLTVGFTGSASGGTSPYTWDWSFGDGSSHATQQNPSHSYSNGGSFQVTLTVTDAAAHTATDSHLTITVTGGGGTCTVDCTATVPTAGTVNQPVTFASTATATNCLGPATYTWMFGDASLPSTQQNPSHTYTSAGSYSWSLMVIAGTGYCMKSGTITISAGGACTFSSCSASAPTTGTAGQSVAFTSTLTSSNCTGSPTYAWTFGDGGTGNTQNPAHAYAAAGSYNWSFTVSQSGQSCSKNGSITISAAPPTGATLWIPSIAHAPGSGTSKWRSNISVANRSGSTANLTLVFVPYSSGATVTKSYTLANGATVEWADVLVSLFAFADSANTKGTVKITSNVAVVAMSRTYNQATSGTFGQYYPALAGADSVTSGQTAVLPMLKKNSSYRTNVGFQNLGNASCTATVKLFSAAGAQVGSTRTLTASTDKYIQDDDVFAKASAGTQDVAYAIVEVTTAGGKAWFYGSVIDAVTNDPTTVPMQR
jgi:PKD repeat protein